MKFAEGKIYKLFTPTEPNRVYIGSTTSSLAKRFSEHLSDYKRSSPVCIHCKSKVSRYSSFVLFERANHLFESVRIELLEAYPCLNASELLSRESEYIRAYKADDYYIVVNKRRASKVI